MKIIEALYYIKGYCEKHARCADCPLSKDDKPCYISRSNIVPCDWDLSYLFDDEKGEEQNG